MSYSVRSSGGIELPDTTMSSRVMTNKNTMTKKEILSNFSSETQLNDLDKINNAQELEVKVKKTKKRFEFSKIMLTLVTSMSLLLTFFGLVYMWVNHDSTLFSYIIGGWFVELATATGFYYNKAKAENVEKFRQNGVLNYTDYVDPERNDM